jgi:hypothetical protein
VQRLKLRPAYTTALGVDAASSTKPLGLEWFEAFADNPEDAESLMDASNNERETKEILAKHGR